MMFVSGETADVAPETTSMVEEIVRDQVQEMVDSIPPREFSHLALTSSTAQASYEYSCTTRFTLNIYK